MCQLLNVSRSGYYEWVEHPCSQREKDNADLLKEIKNIFDREKQRAGSKRITKILRRAGKNASKNRVAKIM